MLAKLSKFNISLKELIGSFLVSLLIISQCFFGISEFVFGTTLIFKVLLVVGCIIAFFCFDKKFSFKHFLIFGVIFCFFGCTFIINNNSSLADLFVSFIIYGCSAFIFSFCKTNEKCIFWCCTLFGLFWLGLFLLDSRLVITNTFSFGYTLLPVTISSFLLLTYNDLYSKKKIPFLIGACLIFSISFVFLVLKGSRGPVLCFILFLLIHFLPALKKWKTAIIYVAVVATLVVLLINAKNIITLIHDAIPGKISFIDKTYDLLNTSAGITNSRLQIIAQIFEEYTVKDFIFGIGIGGYNSSHPADGYTHNLFMSVMLDFGVIGIFFTAFIIVLFFYSVFKESDKRRYPELLMTVSVITLLFSGNYWKYFTLWLLVFYILNISGRLLSDGKKNETQIAATKRSEVC